MNAVPALRVSPLGVSPLAARISTLPAPAHHAPFEETRRGEFWVDESDRLPPGVAFPIILLLSVGSWALIATVGLWLYRVLG